MNTLPSTQKEKKPTSLCGVSEQLDNMPHVFLSVVLYFFTSSVKTMLCHRFRQMPFLRPNLITMEKHTSALLILFSSKMNFSWFCLVIRHHIYDTYICAFFRLTYSVCVGVEVSLAAWSALITNSAHQLQKEESFDQEFNTVPRLVYKAQTVNSLYLMQHV